MPIGCLLLGWAALGHTMLRRRLELITAEVVARVIERERPQALLPTLGGQTALNVAVELAEAGVLDKYGVELIGAKLDAIRRGEDRRLFKECMEKAGIDLPRSGWAYSLDEARALAKEIAYPVIVWRSVKLFGGSELGLPG